MGSRARGPPRHEPRTPAAALVALGLVLLAGLTVPGADGTTLAVSHVHVAVAGTALRSASWSKLKLTANATPVAGQVLAYDAADSELVQFGGITSYTFSGKATVTNQTWVLASNRSWSELHPRVSPAARWGAAAAYDAALRGIVLFGGQDKTTTLTDTWLFSNGSWTPIATAGPRPSSRFEASMAYDPLTTQLVLFGGSSYNTTVGSFELNTTWVFNGIRWSQLATPTAPSARRLAVLSYDAAARSVILFGGCPAPTCGHDLGDTWEYTAAGWKNVTGSVVPFPRDSAFMGFDPARSVLVLFGGENGTQNFNDTWAFSAGAWTQVCRSSGPPAGGLGGMAFDLGFGGMVLTGGGPDEGYPHIGAGTWLYK